MGRGALCRALRNFRRLEVVEEERAARRQRVRAVRERRQEEGQAHLGRAAVFADKAKKWRLANRGFASREIELASKLSSPFLPRAEAVSPAQRAA